MYDPDPDGLIDQLLTRYLSSSYRCPCHPTVETESNHHE